MKEIVLNNCSLNCTMEDISNLVTEYRANNQAGDATWILTSSFIIFTMQSGFGLLEAGSCTTKNECNIMVKNAVDVVFGSLGYWMCGYGFSFGGDSNNLSNGFTGFGDFFTDSTTGNFGSLYAKYVFQLSFATTATTIVSGAMAERTNLKAYILFSFLNVLSYVFPAHWIWDDRGFLKKIGVVDTAGCGPVHIVGGISGLIASIMLKPRKGVFHDIGGLGNTPQMASPTNVVLGTFMLWWGWLGFNCGSTFGVSRGKWKFAARAAVTTINASAGGGAWSVLYSYILTKRFKGRLDVGTFTSGILGGLVSITAICDHCRPWQAVLIGFIGGIITSYGAVLIRLLKIDDPVSCIPVHLLCGIWGLVAVAIFGDKHGKTNRYNGLINGGPVIYLGYQLLAVVCITAWAAFASGIQLFFTDKLLGLRMDPEDERIGADAAEHGINTSHQHTSILGSRRRNTEEDYITTENGDSNGNEYSNGHVMSSSIVHDSGNVCHDKNVEFPSGTANLGFVTMNEKIYAPGEIKKIDSYEKHYPRPS